MATWYLLWWLVGCACGGLVITLVVLISRYRPSIRIKVRRTNRTLPTPPPVHTWEMTTEEKPHDDAE